MNDINKTKNQLSKELKRLRAELKNVRKSILPIEIYETLDKTYKHITENSIDGIGISQEGKIIFVNNAFAEMFAFKKEELIGKSFLCIVSPQDRKAIQERYSRRMQGKEVPNKYEFRGMRKDGKEVFIELSSSKSFLYKNKPTILVVLKDITKQKEALDAADFEHKQFLSMFDSIDEPVYISDPETYKLLYTNQAFRKLWGHGVGKKCHWILQSMEYPCPFCSNERIFGKNLGKEYIWEFQNKIKNDGTAV